MQFKPSIIGLIVSVLLCVAVFLPWITADAMGFSITANGTDVYPGIITLVMGILAVLLSIFAYYRVASVFMVIASLVAAGGIAGYWFLEWSDVEAAGMGGMVTIMPGYGLYVAGGLAIILVIVSFAGLGRSRTPTQYYQAPPQGYQAPPQNYQAPPQSYQPPPQSYNAPPPPPGGSSAPPPPPPAAPR